MYEEDKPAETRRRVKPPVADFPDARDVVESLEQTRDEVDMLRFAINYLAILVGILAGVVLSIVLRGADS